MVVEARPEGDVAFGVTDNDVRIEPRTCGERRLEEPKRKQTWLIAHVLPFATHDFTLLCRHPQRLRHVGAQPDKPPTEARAQPPAGQKCVGARQKGDKRKGGEQRKGGWRRGVEGCGACTFADRGEAQCHIAWGCAGCQ